MAGRKTFTAGEVLQAADVNDFLMDQSVMVFAGTAARGSAIPSPTEGMVTYRSDDDAVEVYDGSSWNAVGPGQILQVVSTTATANFATTSTSFTDVTGLSVTITPGTTSSKVLLFCHSSVKHSSSSGAGFLTFARDNSNIGQATNGMQRIDSDAAAFSMAASFTFEDSPSSTSSLTYTVQARTAAGTFTALNGDITASLVAMEVAS